MTKLAEAFRTIGELDPTPPPAGTGNRLMAGFIREHGQVLRDMERQHREGVAAFIAAHTPRSEAEADATTDHTTDAPESL